MKKLIAVAVIVPLIAVLIAGAMTSGAASCDCWAAGASMGQDKRCRVSCELGMVAVCKDGKKTNDGRYYTAPSCRCVKAPK